MDHYQKLKSTTSKLLALIIIGAGIITIISLWLSLEVYQVELTSALIMVGVIVLIYSLLVASFAARYVLQPLFLLRQAILHVSPSENTSAPDINKARLGRELLTSLTALVYQYASQSGAVDPTEHRTKIVQSANIVSRLPLPLFAFNKDQLVTNASNRALEYCGGIASSDLFGKPLYENIDLEFPSERTLDAWINEVQETKVTDTAYWDRVRVRIPDQPLRHCDIAAYYNRDNPSGTEFIVIMFDRTTQYAADDDGVNFVAMAVHELRTPLTMLRGYVEVFDEELADSLNPELKDFLSKMQSAAKQLTVFVNNILNVARIDENQLILKLTEGNWSKVVASVCTDLELKAKINGKQISHEVEPNLPTVAIDRVSIYEVLNNLLDNAIKYGGDSSKIEVRSYLNSEGFIETSIRDWGLGIPRNVLPHIFEKFSRNHRTKTQVGGTGLGLYLSKALITAHGGNIWVRSKEGEGSTFTFTLKPHAQLADELKNSDNKSVVRTAQGWIKNHSLYRR